MSERLAVDVATKQALEALSIQRTSLDLARNSIRPADFVGLCAAYECHIGLLNKALECALHALNGAYEGKCGTCRDKNRDRRE